MWKFITVLALLSGCGLTDGNGPNGQGSFTRVLNKTGATVVLVSPDEWTFADNFWDADCVDGVLDLFTFSIEGDSLVITATDTTPQPDCRIATRAEDVEVVECEGDGDLEQEGDVSGISTIRVTGNGAVNLDHLETGTLDLYAGGNGKVTIGDLQADMLLLELKGNGAVSLAGAVDEGDFLITGDGELMAQGLVIQDLYIDISGNGDGAITVENTIDGVTSGSGTLNAYGGAEGIVEVTGTGAVTLHE